MFPFQSPSVSDELPPAGSDRSEPGEPGLAARAAVVSREIDAGVAQGRFPYGRRLLTAPGPIASVRHIDGWVSEGINCCSQDHLNLATHPDVKAAAISAIARHGLHGAGAAVFAGATPLADELEAMLAEHLRMPYALLAPTGWSAGHGLLRALAGPSDHVVIDQGAEHGLLEAARAATSRVEVFRHLDPAHARLKLAAIRARRPGAGILLVTESLFAATSDAPDLATFQALAAEFGAQLAVDVSNDLGSAGPDGAGGLGAQNLLGRVDFAFGGFDGALASNGGFVAVRTRELRDYLRHHCLPVTVSGALSPAQTAAALAALRIVRSAEGERRRRTLAEASRAVRSGLIQRGVEVMGVASPVVPVLVGRDAVARAVARLLADAGVIVNVLEYPRVSRASARLLLHMMSGHTPEACAMIAERVAAAIAQARTLPDGKTAMRVA